MELSALRPKPTERLLVVGATGTGKTTLSRELLRVYPSVLVIDPKCTYDPEDDRYKMVRRPSALGWIGGHTHIHYRPSERYQNIADYDEVYRWAYKKKRIMVYTDETYLTMKANRSPDWQRACITCGRELGIGMIFATQRPSGIDLRIYTESENKVCFYLANIDDRKRMKEEMGSKVLVDPVGAAKELTGGEHPHAFWRWNSRDRVTRLAELNLEGRERNGV